MLLGICIMLLGTCENLWTILMTFLFFSLLSIFGVLWVFLSISECLVLQHVIGSQLLSKHLFSKSLSFTQAILFAFCFQIMWNVFQKFIKKKDHLIFLYSTQVLFFVVAQYVKFCDFLTFSEIHVLKTQCIVLFFVSLISVYVLLITDRGTNIKTKKKQKRSLKYNFYWSNMFTKYCFFL